MNDLQSHVGAALAGGRNLQAAMNIPIADQDSGGLIAEIERYLEAVALFRALSCEPEWRDECLTQAVESAS